VLSQEYVDVVAGLRDEDWERPSRCAGWRVQDLVAHTSSNFRVLVEPPPPSEPVPGMTAERAQDLLVEARRGWTPQQVREELEAFRAPAMDVLAAVQEEPAASADLTLHDLGTYPTAALADAFAFDLYCHLRIDLLAPEGPVEHAVPAATDDVLRPGIGWMLTGLPQMCPAVNDVLDQPLGLRLTGPGGGEWTLRRGSGRATVVDGLADAPAVATSAAHDFVLWGTGRADWRRSVQLSGDVEHGARVLDAVDIV
jgi:uncharacterized protein (TIGR03083 family)